MRIRLYPFYFFVGQLRLAFHPPPRRVVYMKWRANAGKSVRERAADFFGIV
jgi:hypothetical protein